MRGVMAMATLGLLGCGRLAFDPEVTDARPDDDVPAGLGPAPAVPASICRLDRVAADVTPASSDLAITSTDEGYAAIWLDTEVPRAAQAVRLGVDHHLIAALALPFVLDTRLGGLVDAGDAVMVASATDTEETVFALSPDLTTVSSKVMRGGQIMGRDPFTSDAPRSVHALLSGSNTTLEMAYVSAGGLIGAPFGNNDQRPITDLACTYGPDHGHCAWAERPDPGSPLSQCVAVDILFTMPTVPRLTGNTLFSDDCSHIRTASGPLPDDAMIVAWTTSTGSVEASYLVGGQEVRGTIGKVGSAPKVQFDGTRFWIAWLDGAGALQLTSFDLTGNATDHAMPGWIPNGPEAFELVHRGNETALAIVRPGELDVLTLCP